MYPEIFHVSFLHTYGFLVALAFLGGLWMASRLGKRVNLNPERSLTSESTARSPPSPAPSS